MKIFYTLILATVTVASASASVSAATSATSPASATGDFRLPGIKRTVANIRFEASDTQKLSDLPLVTEIGDAVAKDFSRDSFFYGIDTDGSRYRSADFGLASIVATADDGTVYFKNPFGGMETGSYLTGTLEGDKITVKFPQRVYSETYPDWDNDPEGILTITDNYYAFRLKYTETEDKSKMEIAKEQTMVFNLTPEGNIVQEGEDFIGMLLEKVNTDENSGEETSALGWTGFADTSISYNVVSATPVTMPADAPQEKWVMRYNGEPRFTNVAFYGDDVYFSNFMTTFPEAVFKGKVTDDGIIVSGLQLLGIDPLWNHYAFLKPAIATPDEQSEDGYIYTATDAVTLAYNREAMTITAPDDAAFAISTIAGGMFLIQGITAPSFSWQDNTTPLIPANPQISDYEYYEEYEYGAIGFILATESIDGRLIDTQRYYYNFFLDNDELTLYPDEYLDLEEPMTNIPYLYEDSDIYFWGDSHEAIIYSTGFDRIGVRAMFENADGSFSYSDIVYNDGSVVGVDSIIAPENTPVRTEYFDLNGMKVSNPARGSLLVKRIVFADGSSKTRKHIVR